MTTRNYNFKIRLNEQQRIKLLLLAAKNGFDNVSQFIRKKVLKQQEQNNLNQRKLSNDYSILDFNMLLKLYEKIKLTKTTDEILNSSSQNFLYVIYDQKDQKKYRDLFNIFGKRNYLIVTLKHFLQTLQYYFITNQIIVFQNYILQLIIQSAISYNNKFLQANKTICQLIQKQKKDDSVYKIQDSQLAPLLLFDFHCVESYSNDKKLEFYWLNDHIIFEIKDHKINYDFNMNDTKQILNIIFGDNFVCFEQLKPYFNKQINIPQLSYFFDCLKQVYNILYYVMYNIQDYFISKNTKNAIKNLFKIDDRRSNIAIEKELFEQDYSVVNLINSYWQKKQPYYSILTNDQQYFKKLDYFQDKQLYTYNKNLEIAYYKVKNKEILISYDKDELNKILSHKYIKNQEQNNENLMKLWNEQEDYNQVNSIYIDKVQEFYNKKKIVNETNDKIIKYV